MGVPVVGSSTGTVGAVAEETTWLEPGQLPANIKIVSDILKHGHS